MRLFFVVKRKGFYKVKLGVNGKKGKSKLLVVVVGLVSFMSRGAGVSGLTCFLGLKEQERDHVTGWRAQVLEISVQDYIHPRWEHVTSKSCAVSVERQPLSIREATKIYNHGAPKPGNEFEYFKMFLSEPKVTYTQFSRIKVNFVGNKTYIFVSVSKCQLLL